MTAEEFVEKAVERHLTKDVNLIMTQFSDNIQAEFNGKKIATNKTELKAWYDGFYAGISGPLKLEKTLQAVDGNVYTVEWVHERTSPDGLDYKGLAMEIFKVDENDQLTEWRAYCCEYEASELIAA